MKPQLSNFALCTEIQEDSKHDVFAVHQGDAYLVSIVPTLAEPICSENLHRIIWFDLEFGTHRDLIRHILSASPEFHLIALSTVLKLDIEE